MSFILCYESGMNAKNKTNISSPQILTLTEAALSRARALLERAEFSPLGLRISITTKGCSGHAYDVSYADEFSQGDEVVEQGGVKIFIDPKAIMFMIGSVMDYREGVLESGFEFINPNETGRCGCGESFTTSKTGE